MDEGKLDRLTGAVHGLVVVSPDTVAPLLRTVSLSDDTPRPDDTFARLHPLERIAFALIGGGSRDLLRYRTAETMGDLDEVDLEACLEFADTIFDIIEDGTFEGATGGPMEIGILTTVAIDARLARHRALEAPDFTQAGPSDDRLRGAVSMMLGARFGSERIRELTGLRLHADLAAAIALRDDKYGVPALQAG